MKVSTFFLSSLQRHRKNELKGGREKGRKKKQGPPACLRLIFYHTNNRSPRPPSIGGGREKEKEKRSDRSVVVVHFAHGEREKTLKKGEEGEGKGEREEVFAGSFNSDPRMLFMERATSVGKKGESRGRSMKASDLILSCPPTPPTGSQLTKRKNSKKKEKKKREKRGGKEKRNTAVRYYLYFYSRTRLQTRWRSRARNRVVPKRRKRREGKGGVGSLCLSRLFGSRSGREERRGKRRKRPFTPSSYCSTATIIDQGGK